jgi:hypothetical protein
VGYRDDGRHIARTIRCLPHSSTSRLVRTAAFVALVVAVALLVFASRADIARFAHTVSAPTAFCVIAAKWAGLCLALANLIDKGRKAIGASLVLWTIYPVALYGTLVVFRSDDSMSKIRAIYVFSFVSRIACGLIATELAVTNRKMCVVDLAGLVVVGSLSVVTISAISHI